MCDLFYEYQAGHAYVDLGLSVKWATLNVGQKNVFEYGDRFAWGDSTPRLDDYNLDNCWCKWLRYQKDEFDVVDGFLFNSKVEGYQGRTLFLPGCGIVYDHSDDGMTEGAYNHYFYSDCFYWSSDLVGQEPSSPDRACMFFINKSPLGHPRMKLMQERRCIVASIRPVFETK